MRIAAVVALTIVSLALVKVAQAQGEGSKKLYRWTDEKGEVHYTDQLPPEAAKEARDELNARGRAVESVARARTPEEQAAFEAEQARLALEKREADDRAQMDAVLFGSYPTEADLTRAYKERFDLVERSIESAEVGIGSQEKSLTDMLNHAADLERSGKPVPEAVMSSILSTRQQAADQRNHMAKRVEERASLQREYERVLARYRELAAGKS
jgi:hypothetical protein